MQLIQQNESCFICSKPDPDSYACNCEALRVHENCIKFFKIKKSNQLHCPKCYSVLDLEHNYLDVILSHDFFHIAASVALVLIITGFLLKVATKMFKDLPTEITFFFCLTIMSIISFTFFISFETVESFIYSSDFQASIPFIIGLVQAKVVDTSLLIGLVNLAGFYCLLDNLITHTNRKTKELLFQFPRKLSLKKKNTSN